MKQVKIRQMRLTDIQAVTQIYSKVFNSSYISFGELDVGRAMAPEVPATNAAELFRKCTVGQLDHADNGLFVAVYDDKIVGFAIAVIREAETGYYECWLDDLAVEPLHHHQGIGCRLVQHVLNWGSRKKVRGFFLESGIHNESAHYFFEHKNLGFKPLSKIFWKDLTPPIIEGTSKVQIRIMTSEDIVSVEEIYKNTLNSRFLSFSHLAESKTSDTKNSLKLDSSLQKNLEQALKEDTSGLFVACVDQEIVGVICTSLIATESGHYECWLSDLSIKTKKSQQDKDISYQLIIHAIEWGYQKEVMYFLFGTDIDDLYSHQVLKDSNLGFQPLALVFWRSSP